MRPVEQGLSLMTALCLLIGVVVVIQIWLLAASLDAALSGDTGVAAAAALASGALCAANVGLLWFASAYDRRRRGGPR